MIQGSVDPDVASYPVRAGQTTDELMVLMLGATDDPADVERHGMIELLRERGWDQDIVVSYHLAPSYVLGDIEHDLHRDIALTYGPRKRRVWLGISAGALVTFGHARRYPDEVDHIIAYAPYLGPKKIIDEIEADGGLASWTANEPIENIERVWQWLRGYAEGAARPRLDLIWGRDDPSRRAQELLAAVLPEDRTHTGPGEHGWDTFMSLLDSFLADHPPSSW